MSDAIGTIDHAVIAVADLASAAATWRRLGFTLSPRGVHSAALGTENHTMMLREDYFEILAVLTPTERNARWRRALAEGGGVAGLAMTTRDPAGAHAYWTKAGLAPDEPIKFSRPVERPDGSRLDARFEVVSLADVPDTAVRVFVCSQPTREAVWLPELLVHANTARAIARVAFACPDPAASAGQWRRILPDARPVPTATGIRVETGRHALDLVRAGVPAPRATGIDFAVDDLAACRAALGRGGIAFAEAGGRLAVAASLAGNVEVGFEAAP
jgi:hypothetical protein